MVFYLIPLFICRAPNSTWPTVVSLKEYVEWTEKMERGFLSLAAFPLCSSRIIGGRECSLGRRGGGERGSSLGCFGCEKPGEEGTVLSASPFRDLCRPAGGSGS